VPTSARGEAPYAAHCVPPCKSLLPNPPFDARLAGMTRPAAGLLFATWASPSPPGAREDAQWRFGLLMNRRKTRGGAALISGKTGRRPCPRLVCPTRNETGVPSQRISHLKVAQAVLPSGSARRSSISFPVSRFFAALHRAGPYAGALRRTHKKRSLRQRNAPRYAYTCACALPNLVSQPIDALQ
jgi:hypothetical protein